MRLTRQRPENNFYLLLVGLVLLCSISVCLAQTSATPAPHEPADVRLVIDISGSMKRNDPHNLRKPSMDLLVRLLPDGSRAGVWTFGRYVNMLVPFGSVDEAWREMAKGRADGINSTGLFTNIGEALEQAAVNVPMSENARPNIILLTDGMVDIDKNPQINADEHNRIITQILPQLQRQRFRLHTIALSSNADTALMEKLAEQTGGTTTVVESADALLEAFLQAFDASAPVTELPLSETNSFIVDSSVEEFTALVFRRDTQEGTHLVKPDGSVLLHNRPDEDIRWHRTDSYDLITVAQPVEGEWRVLADIAPESRITIISNLKLRLHELPANVTQGAALAVEFVLVDEASVITDPAFLSMLAADIELTFVGEESLNGEVWTHHIARGSAPADGVFKLDLPPFDQLGSYLLTVTVDGQTFQRRLKHRLQVQLPFTLHSKDIITDQGEPGFELTVVPMSDNILDRQTQVAVAVTGPDGRKIVRPLVWNSDGHWQAQIPVHRSGDYIGAVKVTGEDDRRNRFEYSLKPIVMTFRPDALMDMEAEDENQVQEPGERVGQPAETVDEEESLPVDRKVPLWMVIGTLVLVNALAAGGGFYLIRRWYRRRNEPAEAPIDLPVAGEPGMEDSDILTADVNDFDEEPLLDEFKMDEVDTEDEAQPADEVVPAFDGAPGNPVTDENVEAMGAMDENASFEEPREDEDVESPDDDDDVGNVIEDIQEELLELVTGDATSEERQEFAADMLKAQGLDLEEDEMDDAISSLIAELDGKSAETDEGESPDNDEDVPPKTS